MVLTFPLPVTTLADLLRIREVSWQLKFFQELSRLDSGFVVAANMGPAQWRGKVKTAPMYHAEAMQVQALFESLDGSINAFDLYNPLAKYPQADPTGSVYGSSTPVIASAPSNKSITISGLPAGYVITRGDMLEHTVAATTQRHLYRAINTVTANGSGITPALEVRPFLLGGYAVSDAINLVKPAAKVVLEPDSFSIENDTLSTCVISFNVIQVF